MKKVKIIFILVVMSLSAGCSANYNLVIDSDNNIYKETTTIYEALSDGTHASDIKIALENKKPAFYSSVPKMDSQSLDPKAKLYQISKYSDSYNYGITYNYNFDKGDYNDSNILISSVENYTISQSKNTMKLQARGFKVFSSFKDLETLKINITVDKTVVYSDADYINDSVYTWVINPSNYLQKKVTLYYKLDDSKNISGDKNIIEKEDDDSVLEPEPPKDQIKQDEDIKQQTEFQKFLENHKVLVIVSLYILFALLVFVVIKIKKIKF